MSFVRYHDLTFQPDMLAARRDDGAEIRLTRQERALLLRLVRQPNMLVTRAQLLDGLGDESGSLGERNIDYLVNRLRKRLGDDARKPRFIATQYGEGYAWLAEPVRSEPVKAFLLVGPVFGLDGTDGPLAALPERLAAALKGRISAERPVLCRPGWRPASGDEDEIAFNLEIAAHAEDDLIHLALVLREGRSQNVMQNFRLTLAPATAHKALEAFADQLLGALWAHAALPGPDAPLPTSNPAHLRMHDAAAMLTGGAVSWRETDKRLRAAIARAPDDPRLKLLLALNLYARLIQSLAEIHAGLIEPLAWNAIEDEIEALALGVLPTIGEDPLLLLGTAKVLFFIDRGHLELAERLTDGAFRAGTAFSAVFSMKGQTAAARGEIGRALDFYRKAVELSEPGSQFHIYLLVLEATALIADGQRAALDQLLAGLKDKSPATAAGLSPFFVSARAKTLPEHLEQKFAAMDIATAHGLLFHLDRISARHFQRAQHRRNVLAGFAAHLQRHHGLAAIPAGLVDVLARR